MGFPASLKAAGLYCCACDPNSRILNIHSRGLSVRWSVGGTSAGESTASRAQVEATLGQLMKGILYPASNVIFAAQSENPANVKPAKDPSAATDPLQSSYGKWEAVENSGLAIAEAANLLTLPGGECLKRAGRAVEECRLGEVRAGSPRGGDDGLQGGAVEESGQYPDGCGRDDHGLWQLP